MNRLLAVDKPPTCAGELGMTSGSTIAWCVVEVTSSGSVTTGLTFRTREEAEVHAERLRGDQYSSHFAVARIVLDEELSR